MDDLIKRQDAITAYCEHECGIKGMTRENCGATDCGTIFDDIPSAQQWIPCSERLPEVHESGNSVSGIYMQSNPVLVYGTCEYEDNAQFHVVTYCDDLDGNTYWSTELDASTVSGVIAWMPLPEPWEGADND